MINAERVTYDTLEILPRSYDLKRYIFKLFQGYNIKHDIQY